MKRKQQTITGSSGFSKKRIVDVGTKLVLAAGSKIAKKAFSKWKKKTNSRQKKAIMAEKNDANDGHSSISSHKSLIVLNDKVPNHDKGLWTYNQGSNGIISGEAGKQAVSWCTAIALNDQLSTSSGLGYNLFQSFQSIFDLNPYRKTTGSNLLEANRVPLTDKFLLKKVEYDLEFTNLTNASVTLDLYFITNKIATDQDPAGIWANGMAEEAQGLNTMNFPIPGGGNGAIGYNVFQNPFTDPNECKTFKKFCKILKHTTFQMGPAAVEVYKTNVIYNKIINLQVVTKDLADGRKAHAGIGIYVLALARGQPVKDLTAPEAPRMTYAQTQIGFCNRSRYCCYSISGNAGRLDVTTAVTNIPFGLSKANQGFIDVEDHINPIDVV